MKKRSGNKLSNFTSTLRSKGKGLCAAALCTTLVLNNIGSSIVSAAAVEKNNNGSMATASDATPSDATVSKENGVYEFELTRQVLYDALQESIANDWQAAPLEAYGDYADDYDSFFEEYGNVYQLKPDIKGSDRKVSLEIYALVEDEIELDSEYMVNGDEQFLFLLTNKSDQEQKAEIFVEDKHTGVVKLVTEATVKSDDFEGSEIVIETEDSKEEADAPTEESKESSDSSISSDSPEGDMPDVTVVGDDEIVISTGDSDDSEKETTAAADEMTGEEESKDVVVENATTEKSEDVEEENNDGEEISIAAISRHEAAWVMATPSNAEEVENDEEETEEAETATPSDAEDKDLLDVELYDAVITEDGAATGLVILAEEMGLDELDLVSLDERITYEATAVDGAEDIIVEASAKKGTLPEGAVLKATLISEDDQKYVDAKTALDDRNMEYSGMMAMDISFWLNGEEVEPTNEREVQVAIRVKDTSVLAEDVDLETVAVQHMIEEDGEIVDVECVADTTVKTDGMVEVSEEEAVAEFCVQSFSTFTFTWKAYDFWLASSYFNIELKYGYINGSSFEEIGGTKNVTGDYINGIGTFYLSEYTAPSDIDLSGYSYDTARYKTTSVSGFKITQRSGSYYLSFVNDKGSDTGVVAIKGSQYNTPTISIEMLYKKSVVSIKDTILENGLLTAVLSEDLNGNQYTYKWYKCEEDSTNWTLVELNSDATNISSDGKSVNVAFDEGARCFYKVEVYEKVGEQETLIGTSEAYQVTYYGELQNGSFEFPNITDAAIKNYRKDYLDAVFAQIPHTISSDLKWKTTVKGPFWSDSSKPLDYYIELVRNNPYKSYGVYAAKDGSQFAELNCQDPGALYQDILTAPGDTLYWSLEHAGRNGGTDSMVVLIADTNKLQGANWNPTSEKDLANEDYYNYRYDIMTGPDSNGKSQWVKYAETEGYKVPAGQYVTRFYFVSYKGDADGNLLDDIKFNKTKPEGGAEKGILTITKEVEGIAQKDIAEIPQGAFKFTVKDSTGKEIKTVTLPKNKGEGFEDRISVDIGEYTVTEIIDPTAAAALTNLGYNWSSTEVKAGSDTPTQGKEIGVEVSEGHDLKVTFTNKYSKDLTLTVKKKVDSNIVDKSNSYSFKATIKRQGNDITSQILDNDGTFELKDVTEYPTEVKDITGLQKGDVIEIEETGTGQMYEVTVSVESGTVDANTEDEKYTTGSAGIQENTVVIFTNKRKLQPPTGLLTDNLPYLMMFAIATIGTASSLYPVARRKRRKSGEE